MKRLITENDVKIIYASGSKEIVVTPTDILTPSAKDAILHLKLKIVQKEIVASGVDVKLTGRISIGADHTGFELKEVFKKFLELKSFQIIDVGTNSKDSCDYPDFAFATAKEIISGTVDFGVMLDATGIPSAIAANKIPGIRAATCYNEFTAFSARSHNNANLLVMGAKSIGEETAKSILQKWIDTKFDGGRHQKRLDKITAIEKKLFKDSN